MRKSIVSISETELLSIVAVRDFLARSSLVDILETQAALLADVVAPK